MNEDERIAYLKGYVEGAAKGFSIGATLCTIVWILFTQF